MRLEAEKERAKAEELRRQAEIKAKSQPQTRTVVVNLPNFNSGSYGAIAGIEGSKNIRSGPGTNYSVVGQGYTGEPVEILGSDYDNGGYIWYKVYHPSSGVTGWMAGQLVSY